MGRGVVEAFLMKTSLLPSAHLQVSGKLPASAKAWVTWVTCMARSSL